MLNNIEVWKTLCSPRAFPRFAHGNVKEIAVNNGANLSIFMLNISHILQQDFNTDEIGVLDIKAHYHRLKYANEVFKLLPKYPDDILMKRIYSSITSIGQFIHVKWLLDLEFLAKVL